MDSNPTPRALVADSYENSITSKKQNNVDNLNIQVSRNILLLIREKTPKESIT
ncbi:hypothetical protein NMY3_02683 [Candidatus Nitrosocosmicus oleophilus]|uniref:Uncharacterized protein n=1 Tax=Candidatus Nitrosocosmicus oleophilus TaxID=1353260 RepID=A0A654M2P7_9ARCH|nr:hypothetical protein [Candidatus Nitrosocosmicus oleophilus]ALI36873.1 hypothetical protein NMY3_02683 [Candidatus Nitrosocosmicus oleophilus]